MYELNENFTSLSAFISSFEPNAYPILIPAIERDLENVCTTSTLSYSFTKSLADTPPKSIYASSTITTTSLLCSIISLTLSRSIKRPVGALGLGKITPPFSL